MTSVSKKKSAVDISLQEDEKIIPLGTVNSETAYEKVLDYINYRRHLYTYDGALLSLKLEKILLETETKPFKRMAFFGDKIVSFGRLAKVVFNL